MDHWEEQYIKMEQEVSHTSTEKKVLAKLRAGCSILECFEKSRFSYKEFSELLKKAETWEINNLCVNEDSK